jgi:hypothetical protein
MNLFRKEMAMKRLMILKKGSGEAFNASSPRLIVSLHCFITSSVSTLYSCRKSPQNRTGLSNTLCESKDDIVFGYI